MGVRIVIRTARIAVVVGCSPFSDVGPRDDVPAIVADAGAGDGSSSPTARGCAGFADAAYCQDFDGPDPLNAANSDFIEHDAGTRGSIDLVHDGATSAPSAALFALRQTPSACSSMMAGKTVVGHGTRLRVRFAVKPSNIASWLEP